MIEEQTMHQIPVIVRDNIDCPGSPELDFRLLCVP